MPTTMNLPKPDPLHAAIAECPPQLSGDQIAQYHRDGFIAFENVLSADEIEGAKAALTGIVETLRLQHRTAENPYGVVWSAIDSRASVQFQRGHEPEGEADPLANQKVRKFFEFVGLDPFLAFLAREQANIQSVLSSLIGPDSTMSQDMALVNPPGIGTGKPWHQDDAYFKILPLDSVCGVWIALDGAGLDNGCMHFLPGWHKRGALRHFHGSDCEIVPDRIEGNQNEVVPVPLKPGGAVFFNGVLPHMTKANTSAHHRRALQYHYRSRDSRIVTDAEYDAVFVEQDGTPASCAAASLRGF